MISYKRGLSCQLGMGDFLRGVQRFSQEIRYVLAVFATYIIHLRILTKYMGIFNLMRASGP